jgi:hypothetical protein
LLKELNPQNKIRIFNQIKRKIMKDFKIKGTELPIIPQGTEYRVVNWYGDNQFTSHEKINFVSYGSRQYGGEDYILADYSNYDGDQFYMFKLKDVKRLVAEQSELTELPKYWVVKRDSNNPDWRKVIDYLNNINSGWNGEYESYYGFDGSPFHSGTNGWDRIESFANNPTLLTIEQFVKLTSKKQETKKEENMVKIKREQLLEIHNIACSTWKSKIEQLAIKSLFGTEIELTQVQVDEMFKAATSTQVPTLEKIFGKQLSELDFRSEDINLKVDGLPVFGRSDMTAADSFIGLPRNESTKDMFFLNPHYTWTLDGCELTVTRKS